MPEYVFRPNLEVVHVDWAANTQLDFPVTDEDLAKVKLVVEAADEDLAKRVRMPITNIEAWVLDESE